MSKKILVSEDYECVSLSIIKALEKYNAEIEQVKNCDEAYDKIKTSIKYNSPYDLLILDLMYSFNDSEKYNIQDGEELLRILKIENINLKILIFSCIISPYTIQYLYNNFNISGFISKGSKDLEYLVEAFEKIFKGEKYFPEKIIGNPEYTTDLLEIDIELFKRLDKGDSVREIALYFEKNKIHPYSQSTLDKRIEKFSKAFGAKNLRDLLRLLKTHNLI